MKIAFFDASREDQGCFQTSFSSHELYFSEKPLSADEVIHIQDFPVISVRVTSKLEKAILEQLPSLKFVSTRSTGFDHIDIVYCKERDVLVSNVPGYGAHSVAEHTFALLLAISRNLLPSVERTRHKDFTNDGLQGFDLFGKTIGVVGAGHIGLSVIQRAKAFGMEVISCSIPVDEELAKLHGFRFVDFERLLKESDIVTFHVPYSSQTHHMLSMDNIGHLKKGSVLLNTARGNVVQTEAVAYGLENGILQVVGLDVWEGEDHMLGKKLSIADTSTYQEHLIFRLLEDKRVFLTAHNAYNSAESAEMILRETVENINSFLSGVAINVV